MITLLLLIALLLLLLCLPLLILLQLPLQLLAMVSIVDECSVAASRLPKP